jgi:hypothetical protein
LKIKRILEEETPTTAEKPVLEETAKSPGNQEVFYFKSISPLVILHSIFRK